MSRRIWMMLAVVFLVGLVVAAFFAITSPKVKPVAHPRLPTPKAVRYVDHTKIFEEAGITQYEGGKSCYTCHEDDALEVVHSYHYLESNKVADIAGMGEVVFGGRMAYNDFCGNIFWVKPDGTVVPINYIGKAVLKETPAGKEDLQGTFIASGCSMCHGVSMGKVPQEQETEEEFANINCLACHTDAMPSGPAAVKQGYLQVVGSPEEGFRYVPGEKFNFAEIAKRIVAKPTNANCLGCHAFSGGGPGFKRPNLNPALMQPDVPEEVDVHIARGMQCVDCHPGTDHAFPSKAVDTWGREAGPAPLCTDCHQVRHTKPVIGWVIETFHAERVACQTCHIPTFGKGGFPTDMKRDWSQVEFSEKMARWEPLLDLREDVEPTYAWWNGETREVYVYPSPADVQDGKLTYVKPVGSRNDPKSKIYPFKYHEAIVPFDAEKKLPIPVKVGVVFATGNVQKAYELGGQPGGLTFKGDFVTLVRYMGVNHGVVPASRALGCFNCHGFAEERMPWRALGYGIYPPVAFTFFTVILPLAVLAAVVYGVVRTRRR